MQVSSDGYFESGVSLHLILLRSLGNKELLHTHLIIFVFYQAPKPPLPQSSWTLPGVNKFSILSAPLFCVRFSLWVENRFILI